MCHSNVGSEVYMAPEVINRRRDDYAYHLGYDGAKVGVHGGGKTAIVCKGNRYVLGRPTSLHSTE